MVWQPNILNNCYELSGGYAPRTTHQELCKWTPLGDFRSPDPLCPHLQILAMPLMQSSVRRFPGKPLVRSGQNSKFTLFRHPFILNKLLVNNVFHNSEKWGSENFLVGHFWGVLPFYPLRGSGPQILIMPLLRPSDFEIFAHLHDRRAFFAKFNRIFLEF